ncbi:hypothetical protein HNQ51_001315 [Inhella inkyongensis]|uniref:Uncharacterized protein n=1 Tax=Inhella inkyongensis TaxID=392593 RepID=A0A840S3A9_9BURK|nr:hypothetical protein [Inhella inkyongensis]MBB5204022.1 hypothetical protein [Inhella inkyongensis]
MLAHLLIWLFMSGLMGFWSLACWGLYRLLHWPGWAAGEDWAAHLPTIELPRWLADWIGLDVLRDLLEVLAEIGPELQRAWAQVPEGWLNWGLGLLWGGGLFLLLLVGLGLSALWSLIRRTSPRPATASGAV